MWEGVGSVWYRDSNTPLRLIRIILLTNLLDSNLHAVFRELHILLFHLFLSLVGEVVGPDVHLLPVCQSCDRQVESR